VDQFVRDTRPDAYLRLVDRLLADPAYGERWGRVWLDLARYADTAGYAQDPERTIWRYRDWVIKAINANLPFDQFTIEQLAGDLLPSASTETLIATAFHRNTMTNSEGGTDDEEFRVAAVVDRVNTTGQVWLGLTVECAHCHDHKYDPILQEEYFGLFALWNNTADADRGDESPNLEEWSPEQDERRQALTRAIARLETLATEDPQRKQLDALRSELKQIQPTRTPIMRELPSDQWRTTQIHVRGNFRQKGDKVEAGVPDRLGPEGIDNRLEFARWLVRPNNPLTARVTVNRYWEKIFGTGIVQTSEDFGSQGELPSHPELLDYLACELVDSGWDSKQLVRLLVTSATYRQSSRVVPEVLERDPRNRLLSHGPRSRLSAEAVRDQALAAAGLLSRTMYGPSVRPPQPKLGQNAAFGGSVDWDPSPGEDRYRRGLYTFWRRTSPYPAMITFDAPSREFCTVRRIQTNTPLQALVTLNDPVFVEAAQGLARRMMGHGSGRNANEIATAGFRQVLARRPEPAELASLVELYQNTRSHFAGQQEQARALATDPLGPLPPELDLLDAAAWTVVANVLLNLDETLSPP
jgi:hypothetical protein